MISISTFYLSGPGKRLVCFLALLFWGMIGPAYAKSVLYDGRDGLSSNSIGCIAKDGRGMMWIGTSSGLNLFDGYTFTTINGPLKTLGIGSIVLRQSGKEMLVGTLSGLYRVNLQTLQAHFCDAAPDLKAAWPEKEVTAIYPMPGSQSVYVAFADNTIAMLGPDNRLLPVQSINAGNKQVSSITSNLKGELIVTIGDLYNLDLGNNQLEYMSDLNAKAPYAAVKRYGNVLMMNGFNSGLRVLDAVTMGNLLPRQWRDKNGAFLHKVEKAATKDNKLYLLCDNYSFYIADLNTQTLTHVSSDYPHLFEGKIYRSIYVDDHKIIWIGTNKGLIKLEEKPNLFSRELYNLPTRVSTRNLLEDKNGDLYVCSYTGLWAFSQEKKSWTLYDRLPNIESPLGPQEYDGTLHPLTLFPESSGNGFYAGSDGDRLFRFDKRTKNLETIPYTTSGSKEKLQGIYSMAMDKNGLLWLGCGNGLARYDTSRKQLTLPRNNPFDLGPTKVRHLQTNAQGDIIYAGTTKGLYIISISEGVLMHFDTSSSPALTHNDVLFVNEDKAGNLWLGTNGGGINILGPGRKKASYIRKADGLSSEVVYSIVREGPQTYWISTFNGLDRYQSDIKSFSNYFEDDGLSSDEFNQNSYLKTRKGDMIFGGINGITSFSPDRFGHGTPFKVFLSGISKWDPASQSLAWSGVEIDSHSVIVKKSGDPLMELHFGCTDYSDPLRNSYSYRIKQISNKWVSLEDRHTFNLGGLPYGTYDIEIKAINPRGAASSNQLLLQVHLVQPFYKTWWFFALLLLILGGLLYTAYSMKSQNFKNVLHLRMRIASNLHDEVGSLLTRITMFSENLRYGKNTEQQRNTKLEKIAVLSRDAVASMSDVLWAIDSRNDFAGDLLDRIREHAEDMLTQLGIEVNFVVQSSEFKNPIGSHVRGELYLIFKEAVNNIARHSKATRVEITYRVNEKNYLLRIANNGVEPGHGEWSTGQGLSNMKMRASRIGATVEQVQQKGTFTIEIKN